MATSKEKEKGTHHCPRLSTAQYEKQSQPITGKLISDLVLQVLSYVSQVEREQIKQRQMEGIKEAKKRGTKFGRPSLETPGNYSTVLEKYNKKRT